MNGGDWGFWGVQGMLGSVGFNWQLGSLATGWGQGGVQRGGEAGEPETGRSDLFFFSTSAHQRMIDLSEPIFISLALTKKAEFRPFPGSEGHSSSSSLLSTVTKIYHSHDAFPICILPIPSFGNLLISTRSLSRPS